VADPRSTIGRVRSVWFCIAASPPAQPWITIVRRAHACAVLKSVVNQFSWTRGTVPETATPASTATENLGTASSPTFNKNINILLKLLQ
jgi:hypothetical protein